MQAVAKQLLYQLFYTSNRVPIEGKALGDQVFTATESFNMKIRIMGPSKYTGELKGRKRLWILSSKST